MKIITLSNGDVNGKYIFVFGKDCDDERYVVLEEIE